jgi:VanZ family protein
LPEPGTCPAEKAGEDSCPSSRKSEVGEDLSNWLLEACVYFPLSFLLCLKSSHLYSLQVNCSLCVSKPSIPGQLVQGSKYYFKYCFYTPEAICFGWNWGVATPQ